MPQADLAKSSQVDTSNDSIIIRSLLEDIPGGKTLDVTGVTQDVLNAGHLIIVETASGVHKPMPVNTTGDAYEALPAGHTFKGVLVATILTAKAFASIMVRGSVNKVASVIAPTTAAITALPLITFTND